MMKSLHSLIKPLVLILLTLFMLFQGGITAQQSSENQRNFGFERREIYQFKKKLSQLAITDMNGDALDDVIFLNNRMSRVEILIRKKEPDTFDSGFRLWKPYLTTPGFFWISHHGS